MFDSCKTSAFLVRNRNRKSVVLVHFENDHSNLKRIAKHFKRPYSKTGIWTSLLLLLCRHIECERNLMAQRPAPLNMNKPSSAETQAKPNSARRHHSRTGQEALELFLASTVKLHPPPSLAINPRSQSQLPIKKKIMT